MASVCSRTPLKSWPNWRSIVDRVRASSGRPLPASTASTIGGISNSSSGLADLRCSRLRAQSSHSPPPLGVWVPQAHWRCSMGREPVEPGVTSAVGVRACEFMARPPRRGRRPRADA